MAGYYDGNFVDYWQGYHEYSKFDPPIETSSALPVTISVNSDMVKDVQNMLEQVHGINIPKPIKAFYKDWSQDPYGGAWHGWNPYILPTEAIKYMRQPFKSLPFYICGEAYSFKQAWVEGALNSAELMLEQKFNLPRASWIPKSYNLGP